MQYKQSRWDLLALGIKNIEASMKTIEERVASFEKKKKLLKNTISQKTFLSLIAELEDIVRLTTKLGVYANLRFSENSKDQKAVAEMSSVEQFLTQIQNRLLYFSLWFKHLPQSKASELINASKKYKYYLEYMRKLKPHTLEEKEEKIINIKDNTGQSALLTLYELITSHFEFKFQGKNRTQEEMYQFIRNKSSKVREQAYKTLLAPYIKNKDILGEIYKNILNDWRAENIELRGHRSPIAVRNTINDIPDEAVEALLAVCSRNEHLFTRFFEIKRKRLKLKTLRRVDIYAPIRKEKADIPYDTAVQLVLSTFQGFNQEFYDAAKKIIDNNHVHSTVQQGKRPGAFCCSSTTSILPYILLSYTKTWRDVSTLAHELGHGIHAILASKQTEFTQEACLPLAETASIFSEMLLSEKILKENPNAAKQLIFMKLDDIYASIIRQAGFVRFEIQAHEMIKQGKTVDEMSQAYLAALRQQLGKNVEVDDIFAYEWAYIPHIFHTPFYCYAYAFGNLLTLALYKKYKQEGEPFVKKIITMLSMGSSASPVEITKIVGVDITSQAFWQQGFDAIEEMIRQLEE